MRIETERLILREWRNSDHAPYAAFNADPEVRRFFYPELKTAAETAVMIDEMIAALAADGFGFLGVERKSDGTLIGDAGLSRIDQLTQDAMDRPVPVEIGWFFGKSYWGQGYAMEAARAVLDWTWREVKLPELVSLACAGNVRSRHLMTKLGMTLDPQSDFEDPTVPVGHWQRPHVIYRIGNPSR